MQHTCLLVQNEWNPSNDLAIKIIAAWANESHILCDLEVKLLLLLIGMKLCYNL